MAEFDSRCVTLPQTCAGEHGKGIVVVFSGSPSRDRRNEGCMFVYVFEYFVATSALVVSTEFWDLRIWGVLRPITMLTEGACSRNGPRSHDRSTTSQNAVPHGAQASIRHLGCHIADWHATREALEARLDRRRLEGHVRGASQDPVTDRRRVCVGLGGLLSS